MEQLFSSFSLSLSGPLEIFPPGLDHSLLIAVWVGALILFACTEVLGWGFVGLVTPGYLAAVFISRPTSGWAIVVEVLLTLAVVRAHLDLLPRMGWVYTPFGRERFFLIVLWGTAVRLVCESWLFGTLLSLLPAELAFQWGLDRWQPDFFGIGLVLVPLTANMLWRNHLRAGGIQLVLATSLTWAVLVYLLLPYTNLSLSEFQLLYEDAAMNLAAQPKVYVILLVGALLAARANQRYGWDFNGILVPSLLGIAWLWPVKVFATVVDVVVVVMVARALVKLPGIAQLNIEGPRRIIIVLTLDILYKGVVAQAAPYLHDALATSDMFGFGYLLPSLMATKMWVKRDIPQVILPTGIVSVQSFVVGSAVAWLLQLVPLPQLLPVEPPHAEVRQQAPAPQESLEQRLALALRATRLEQNPEGKSRTPLRTPQATLETLALTRLAQALRTPMRDLGTLEQLAQQAQTAGYQVLQPELEGWLALGETTESRHQLNGHGLILVRSSLRGLSQGRPLQLWILPAGHEVGDGRARVSAHLLESLPIGLALVPGSRWTLEGALQPTEQAQLLSRHLTGAPRLLLGVAEGAEAEGLYLPAGLAADFPLASLQQIVGAVPLRWQRLPSSLQPWISGAEGTTATLLLTREKWQALASTEILARSELASMPEVSGERFAPELLPWLMSHASRLTSPDPLPSQAPTELRLARWRYDVLEPLLRTLSDPRWAQKVPTEPSPEADAAPQVFRDIGLPLRVVGKTSVPESLLTALLPVAEAAQSLGYALEVAFPAGEWPVIALTEQEPSQTRTGGLFLRPGAARPWLVEVLEPEASGLVALGGRWWLGLDAVALLIDGAPTGADMQAGVEGLAPLEQTTFFQLAHERLVAFYAAQGTLSTTLRLEAAAAGQTMPAEAALAGPMILGGGTPTPGWLAQVQRQLEGLGISVALQQGEAWSASLRLPPAASVRYASSLSGQQLVQVRISRTLRQSALGEVGSAFERAAAWLGLERERLDLQRLLESVMHAREGKVLVGATLERGQEQSLLAALADLQTEGGVSRLLRLVKVAQMPGRRLSLVRDTRAGGLFLLSRSLKREDELWCLNLASSALTPPKVSPQDIVPFVRGFKPLWSPTSAAVAYHLEGVRP
ncbi:MAG: poly-gamma-glutamate biosynthesis protein PgsC/CapC [Myxococcota bacterium]